MKKKRRFWRVGDTIKCKDWSDVTRTINRLARIGVDAKPTGEDFIVEVVDVDRRK